MSFAEQSSPEQLQSGAPAPAESTITTTQKPSPLRVFYRLLGLIHLSLRRLRFHGGLSLLALIGVILAVGLVTSAGFFSHAVDTVVMRQELAEYSRVTGRPPFAIRIFAVHSDLVPLSVQRAEELGERAARTLADAVGLPIRAIESQLNSGVLRLRPAGGTATARVNLIHLSQAGPHLEIVKGAEYSEEPASPDFATVWLHADLAEKLGAEPGDRFELLATSGDGSGVGVLQVAGVWQPADVEDPYWFSNPEQAYSDAVLLSREDYIRHVEPLLAVPVRSVNWRVVLDENAANPSQGRQYVSGFEQAEPLIQRFLPEARVTTPSLPLANFVNRQTTLTTLLLGFNVPGLGFLIYFLVLTSAVIAYWQRREIAVLVSRGMGRLTVLNFTLVETVLLFLIGLPLGLAFGALLARLMGYVASFLVFQERAPLPVSWAGANSRLIALTLGIVLVSRLWAALTAGRTSVVDQEREHVRPRQGPFWYRNYLDLLLVIPTLYGFNQLISQDSLSELVQDRPQELWQDPLLVLVPALFIVTLALIGMRPFPWVMRLLDLGATHMPGLSLHLALRQLGRQSHTYINPLLLVIVSLALGVYTFSMAGSLDNWLVERIYYRTGADLTFEPFSETESLAASISGDWIPPTDEFAALPDVNAATRVGDYKAEAFLAGNQRVRGRFLGVDRLTFPSVAFFRQDFAPEPLGSLMNRLAIGLDNVLVSRAFLEQNSLAIGDRLEILVVAEFGASARAEFTIAGVYEYFPTVYPDEITFVGNLDYIFAFFGMDLHHNIWMRLAPEAGGELVVAAINSNDGLDLDTIREMDVSAMLEVEQAQMERVGVFGTLTVSFLVSALMAALGLLTYSYASLNERLYHFSVLRAVGMFRRQLASQVLLEYLILTAYGALVGVAIGTYAAQLFVPLFRPGVGANAPLPPLIPVINSGEIWPLVIAFAGTMILLELLVLSSALYRRIFTVLRMGYTG